MTRRFGLITAHLTHRSRCLLLAIPWFLIAGCDSLRLAPSEEQKQNAWLHNRTAAVAAETAQDRADLAGTSGPDQALGACRADRSHPTAACPRSTRRPRPPNRSWRSRTGRSPSTALAQSAERPDPWQVADSALGHRHRCLCPVRRRPRHAGPAVPPATPAPSRRPSRRSSRATSCSRRRTPTRSRPSRPPSSTSHPKPASSSRP